MLYPSRGMRLPRRAPGARLFGLLAMTPLRINLDSIHGAGIFGLLAMTISTQSSLREYTYIISLGREFQLDSHAHVILVGQDIGV